MSKETMRAFDFEGKRRGIRLDEGTWQAIDWLAEQRGVKWAELAREWATLGKHAIDSDKNMTRIIRSSAVQALLAETIFNERAEMFDTPSGPIWQSLGVCDDEGLDYALAQAKSIEGHQDFGGFTLHAGVSEHGNAAFYIRSSMKDGDNLIISTPFRLEEWAERMGS